MLLFISLALISLSYAQMSTDPRICGGYMREVRGHIDFTFNEDTAPPGTAMGKKFCVWTISPTVPTEQFRYNMTIRNVNLDCNSNKDWIGINYFDEESTEVNLHPSWNDPRETTNPLCIESHEVWERKHINGTTLVVILYVEEIEYGKGFYLEWEEGYDSRLLPSTRMRTTYYSYGKPSVAPNPYFAAGFHQNQIATFAFPKANFTDGYVMEMNFWEVRVCEGQNDWMQCFNDTFTVFQIENNAILTHRMTYSTNVTDTEPLVSTNGFFIIVKIEDKFMAGGRFTMFYDTIRG